MVSTVCLMPFLGQLLQLLLQALLVAHEDDEAERGQQPHPRRGPSIVLAADDMVARGVHLLQPEGLVGHGRDRRYGAGRGGPSRLWTELARTTATAGPSVSCHYRPYRPAASPLCCRAFTSPSGSPTATTSRLLKNSLCRVTSRADPSE